MPLLPKAMRRNSLLGVFDFLPRQRAVSVLLLFSFDKKQLSSWILDINVFVCGHSNLYSLVSRHEVLLVFWPRKCLFLQN